jgi:hypothetical protein
VSAESIGGDVRALARYVAKSLAIPEGKLVVWPLVRALAFVGFLVFGAATTLSWLRTAILRPLNTEEIKVRDVYGVSPIERDIALLHRWLPTEGKVGYWSELPQFRMIGVRLRLAPLLLDPDWRKHELVLVDYVAPPNLPALASAGYRLWVTPPGAESFAGGMQIYRRSSR